MADSISGYTKTETDNLLSAKADSSDVPTTAADIGAATADQVTGYDTKSVAGTASIDSSTGTWALDLTDDATVTITGGDGATVALDVQCNSHTLTISDGPTITDDGIWALLHSRGAWHEGGKIIPDTTPPTAGTLSVAVTDTTATLSVTGALDETALSSTPYAFSKDGGSTWTAWQADATYEYTGLTASTSYTFEHKVRDAAGNTKTGASVTKSTTSASAAWTTYITDGFTAADGTAIDGRTTDTGSQTWSSNVAGLTHGETAQIESDEVALSPTSYNDVNALIPWPTASTTGLRVTFDYDVSAGNGVEVSAYICTYDAGGGAPAFAWIKSGQTVAFACTTNDTWGTPTVATTAPDTGTAVAEYHRNTDGTLTYTLKVGGTTVLSVAGTAASYRYWPGSSQHVGIAAATGNTTPVAAATFDNVKVEYI